jgi:hypothetical protein
MRTDTPAGMRGIPLSLRTRFVATVLRAPSAPGLSRIDQTAHVEAILSDAGFRPHSVTLHAALHVIEPESDTWRRTCEDIARTVRGAR